MGFATNSGVQIGIFPAYYEKALMSTSPLRAWGYAHYLAFGHYDQLVDRYGNRVLTKELANTKKLKNNHRLDILTSTGKEAHQSYYGSHKCTYRYAYLAYLANDQQKELTLATVALSDSLTVDIYIRKSGANMLLRLLRRLGWDEPFFLVIEECDKSKVTNKAFGRPVKRINLHILTIGTEESRRRLKALLKRLGTDADNAVSVQTTYEHEQPYTVCHQIEEEQFGDIPTNENHSEPYWLNQWQQVKKRYIDNQWRQVTVVCTRKPIDSGVANYMSKTLHKPITKGGNLASSGIPSLAEIADLIAEAEAHLPSDGKTKVLEDSGH